VEVTWIIRESDLIWGLQFAVELIKELNKMLGIETKLSTLFHLQTNSQTKRMS